MFTCRNVARVLEEGVVVFALFHGTGEEVGAVDLDSLGAFPISRRVVVVVVSNSDSNWVRE